MSDPKRSSSQLVYIIDQPQKKNRFSLVNDEQGNGAGGNTPMSYRFRYPSVIVSQYITDVPTKIITAVTGERRRSGPHHNDDVLLNTLLVHLSLVSPRRQGRLSRSISPETRRLRVVGAWWCRLRNDGKLPQVQRGLEVKSEGTRAVIEHDVARFLGDGRDVG